MKFCTNCGAEVKEGMKFCSECGQDLAEDSSIRQQEYAGKVIKCPHCGETLYPYGYNGSPLSGRVDLQAICDCGWSGFEMVSGWRIRSEALKAAQHSDTWRRRLFKLKSGTTSTIYDLLDWPHKE